MTKHWVFGNVKIFVKTQNFSGKDSNCFGHFLICSFFHRVCRAMGNQALHLFSDCICKPIFSCLSRTEREGHSPICLEWVFWFMGNNSFQIENDSFQLFEAKPPALNQKSNFTQKVSLAWCL
ncbi:unnamed protein product [Eretmochelys imbricata]